MSQTINASTPSRLLASSIAAIAVQVGGYKDGFSEDQAKSLLSQLFDTDPDTPESFEAFATLKSIYNRAEGAEAVVLKLPPSMVAEVLIELADTPEGTTVTIGGIDSRQSVLDGLIEAQEAEREAIDALMTDAAQVIRDLREDRDRLQRVVDAYQPAKHKEAAPHFYTMDDWAGDVSSSLPTMEQIDAGIAAYFGDDTTIHGVQRDDVVEFLRKASDLN
jgi:hypothetical protein